MQAVQSQKKVRLEASGRPSIELDASEVIKFYFDDCKTGLSPEFVHQNFGEEQKISWFQEYMPLNVGVYVNTNDLTARVKVTHGDVTDSVSLDASIKDILQRISSPCEVGNGCTPAKYPGDLANACSEVCHSLILASEKVSLSDGFFVERFSASDFPGKSFDTWKRAEWLMLWFIESVSQSAHETDPNWEYYVLRCPENRVVAMCSVYRFPSFSFVTKGVIGERVRISQFLTLPSMRKGGHGTRLLQYLAERVMSKEDIDMLTMEDPSWGMTSLRESVYLRLANRAGLLVNSTSTKVLESELKIPLPFARRIRRLIEINELRNGHQISNGLVRKIVNSGNKFVTEFIDSIEFYDESTERSAAPDSGPIPLDVSDKLIHDSIQAALRKLERVVCSAA